MPDFRFRRQFLVGPGDTRPAASWRHARIGPLHVHTHPDLAATRARSGTTEVLLLGYAFDASDPRRDDDAIVRALAQHRRFDDVVRAASELGGTYVLLVRTPDAFRLVHDACGLREVCYTTGPERWVASQPALLATVRTLDPDPDPAAAAFSTSAAFEASGRLWPGPATGYRGLRHLLPNHYVDLTTGRSARYWPLTPLAPTPVDEAAGAVAGTLSGFVEAAARRYRLSLGVTAGWDSRVLLAASRPHRRDIDYFIVDHGGTSRAHRADRRVAARLARRLSVPLAARPYGPDVAPAFALAYRESLTGGREQVMAEWYHVFLEGETADMTVNGNVSEVARRYFGRIDDVTPEDLCTLVYGAVQPYAAAVYGAWLETARPLCDRLGYDVLDLFYWEERMGRWAARTWSEVHLATDMYAPFNCRRLLERLLSVHPTYRDKHDNELYRRIVARLWPEGLREPFNPHPRNRIIRLMKRLGLYAPYTAARRALQR